MKTKTRLAIEAIPFGLAVAGAIWGVSQLVMMLAF